MWGISGAELVVLLVVVLVVAGPERLPEFAAQLGRLTREFKRIASGARERVRDEFGEEFDSVDLTMFDPRQYDPRRIVRDALLEDEPVARPRPRADRRGVTAPSSPMGSHRAGAQPATAATTAAAAADAVAADAVAHASAGTPATAPPAPIVVGGPTGLSEPPARSSATGTPGAAPRPASASQARPGVTAPPAAPTSPQQPGARVLSPKEIVARTRGVRPAYESPAVVAALGAVGLTPEEIRAAAQDPAQDAAREQTLSATGDATPPTVPAQAAQPGTGSTGPSGASPGSSESNESSDREDYVVPFDDEAT